MKQLLILLLIMFAANSVFAEEVTFTGGGGDAK